MCIYIYIYIYTYKRIYAYIYIYIYYDIYVSPINISLYSPIISITLLFL